MQLAGSAISVTDPVTLPAQPTAGAVNYVPLGGDGYTSPFAAYSVVNYQVSGDVSGGTLTARINMDNRFCALVSYVTLQNVQATPGDAEIRLTISDTLNRVPRLAEQGDVTSVAVGVTTASITKTWFPTPTILPGGPISPFINASMANVDSDEMFLDAWIYLFNIAVREKTPMGPLLWARGAT